jgi:hypothetical protein
MRTRFIAIALATHLLCGSGFASQSAFTVEQLLDRAALYVADFVTKLSRVVAEEQYVQEYLDAGVEGSRGTFIGSPKVRDRRVLKSDLLLVKPSESQQWHVFRDVFEVDGRPVRDREDRLAKLFLQSHDTDSALERAHQIAAESARFNIRQIGTIDHPLLALGFLQRAYRDRFRFTVRGRDAAVGADTWIVEFRETARPTIIRGSGDKDIFARGRYWINATDGHVMRAEVVFNALGTESSVTTAFAVDDRLRTLVPVAMRFRRAASNNEVRGAATYGRFRQFEVGTEESIEIESKSKK